VPTIHHLTHREVVGTLRFAPHGSKRSPDERSDIRGSNCPATALSSDPKDDEKLRSCDDTSICPLLNIHFRV
jgi:hypothetical protein